MKIFLAFIVLILCICRIVGCDSNSSDELVEKQTQQAVPSEEQYSTTSDAQPVDESSDPEQLSTNNKFEKGQLFLYVYRKLREVSGKPKVDEQTNLEISVLDVDEHGYLFRWRLILPATLESDQSYTARLARLGSIPIRVRVDHQFESVELENAVELYEAGIETAELIAEMNEMTGAAREQVMVMFRDEAFSKNMYLKPIQLFFLAMGWEGTDGVSRVIQTSLPSLWSEPLPATLTVRLDKDASTDQILFDYQAGFEQDQIGQAIRTIMTSFAQQMSIDHKQLDPGLFKMDIGDHAFGKFSPTVPLPIEFSFERRMQVDVPGRSADKRFEAWYWTLQKQSRVEP